MVELNRRMGTMETTMVSVKLGLQALLNREEVLENWTAPQLSHATDDAAISLRWIVGFPPASSTT